MIHPKMRYTYVGVDSHKDTHTAVLLDCFFEKLGEIVFANRPSMFAAFLAEAETLKMNGTDLSFGLEDATLYGRTLANFLTDNNKPVKHVNALLVARERKNQNIVQKSDSVDAECAARVLLSKFDSLPSVEPHSIYYILRSVVIRHKFVIRNNAALKNHLHDILTQHYPNYREFFDNIDCKTSLLFFMRYPSPNTLAGTTLEELTRFLHEPSNGRIGEKIAQLILDSLEDTAVEHQEIRDLTVQSTIRQIRFNLDEIETLEDTLAQVLARFDTTLTTMTGIDVVTASRLLSCIGDIKKFSTPAKLARYAGIAPVTYGSGKNYLQFANQRGNRELHAIFFQLAVRLIGTVGRTNKVINPFFYDYYHRKLSEGKTKKQALKCAQRRLVNIIWSMLTNTEEYVNPPMFNLPKKKVKC